MTRKLARALAAVALMAGLLAALGGSSQAGVLCRPVDGVGIVCVTTPPDGVEVFITSDEMQSEVTGVGIECDSGEYYFQRQNGGPATYVRRPLITIGTDCPLFH